MKIEKGMRMGIYEPESESAGRFFDHDVAGAVPWDDIEEFLADRGIDLVPGRVIIPEGSHWARVRLTDVESFADFVARRRGRPCVIVEEAITPKEYRNAESASTALRGDGRFSRWSWLHSCEVLHDLIAEWVEHDLGRDASIPTSMKLTAVGDGVVATCTVDSGYLAMPDYVYACVQADPELQSRLREAGPYD